MAMVCYRHGFHVTGGLGCSWLRHSLGEGLLCWLELAGLRITADPQAVVARTE